jgi:phenylalanyl-tRNA synthetase beta chain
VARLYGYDQIDEPAQSIVPNVTPKELPDDLLRRKVRARLAGLGYRELYTNSMLPQKTADFFAAAFAPQDGSKGGAVAALNPISQEMAALRPSLLPGLLQVMGFNQKHGQRLLRFMEFGHVFRRTDRTDTIIPGYAEHEAFILGLSGPRTDAGWDTPAREADFFDLKADVEALLDLLRVPDVETVPVYEETPATAYHLALRAGGREIGRIARLADALAAEHDLRAPAFFAELDWSALVALGAPSLSRRFQAVSRYPAVERDVAVVVDRTQPAGPMLATIRRAAGDLLRHAGVFDLYEGDRIAAGRKSIAFSLRFAADRTLQDEEVDARIAQVVDALAREHGAVRRQ